MADKLDTIIKCALDDAAGAVSKEGHDDFSYIKKSLQCEVLSNEKKDPYEGWGYWLSNFTLKKKILALSCAALVFTGSIFAFSGESRVLAAQTINSIKTIFITEKVNGEVKVVEKSSDDACLYTSSGESTELTGAELEKKLGYQVNFPEKIGEEFKLSSRSIGVGLRKGLSYDQSRELEPKIKAAATDDSVLEELREYDPHRFASAFYSKNDTAIFHINALPATGFSAPTQEALVNEAEKYGAKTAQIVKGKNLTGVLIEISIPQYDLITVNGTTSYDMTKPPKAFTTTYTFMWTCGSVSYNLGTMNGSDLPKDSLVAIAEEFQEAQ